MYYRYGYEDVNKIISKEGVETYIKLDDRILGDIARSTEDELAPARNILKCIQERRFYRRIGEILDSDRDGQVSLTHIDFAIVLLFVHTFIH